MAEQKRMSKGMKFLFGGLVGMAGTCIVHPLDLVKMRMQISGTDGKKEFNSSFHCLQSVVTKEGPLALYKGISASMLRQATYATARLGVYTNLNEHYLTKYQAQPGFGVRAVMSMVSGASGAFVGTPADLALIRMAADGSLPPAERRNYKNVVNALSRIVQEEGPLMLFRGCIPTVSRAIVVNMAQFATYPQAKEFAAEKWDFKEGVGLHFVASMFSGFVTTIVSMPVDITKTRIQNMKTVGRKPEYSGALDVLAKVVKNEGLLALWKGFTPYYCRLGPQTVLIFVILEQFNKLYSEVLGDEGGHSEM